MHSLIELLLFNALFKVLVSGKEVQRERENEKEPRKQKETDSSVMFLPRNAKVWGSYEMLGSHYELSTRF